MYRLENRTGHFKFYEIWAVAYENAETGVTNKACVGTRWGKIGTEGQTKLIEFEGAHCKAEAYDFVQKKIQEKLSRGYEIVKSPASQMSVETEEEQEPEQEQEQLAFPIRQ